MIPRIALLNQPHMESLRDHPAIIAMPDPELHVFAAFMTFCVEHQIGDPCTRDIRAFASLKGQTPDALVDLAEAFDLLELPETMACAARETAETQRHRLFFKGITKGASRTYTRSISVPVEELPTDWQKTLRRLHFHGGFSPSILDRMERRLGMFVWSAQQAGQPIDLDDTPALQALYVDMRARSAAKNDGVPRWAYLRSTWEELRRFSRAHGLSQGVWNKLTKSYDELVRLEARQEALKIAKARAAGTLHGLLKEADELLTKAEHEKHPQMRHALRNRAAAIALGCAVPARPEDVRSHHILGVGITFEPGRGAYRFRYTPTKTSNVNPRPLNIPLQSHWNRFIDALILQDQDPSYLGELRSKAMAEQRPLYVQYDGTPAAYPWYSRMWKIVAKTGGHIARTLVYDEGAADGEIGIQYGRLANGHAPEGNIVARYRSKRAAQALIAGGQDIMSGIHGDIEEDISDLL